MLASDRHGADDNARVLLAKVSSVRGVDQPLTLLTIAMVGVRLCDRKPFDAW